jgi:hypothetical protein
MLTKENAKDWLPLVRALAEGKTIQLDLFGQGRYYDVTIINLDYEPTDYRVVEVTEK